MSSGVNESNIGDDANANSLKKKQNSTPYISEGLESRKPTSSTAKTFSIAKHNSKAKNTKTHTTKEKKSRSTSCYLCQKRKQKCDQRFPSCTNCIKAHVKCIQPPRYGENYRAHVKDDYTILLEKKFKQLENLLDQTTKNISRMEKEAFDIAAGHSQDLSQNQTKINDGTKETIHTSNKTSAANSKASTKPSNESRSSTSKDSTSSKILKYRKIGDLLDTSRNTARSYLPYDQFDNILNKPYEYFVSDNSHKFKFSLVSHYSLMDYMRYNPSFNVDLNLSKQLIDIYFTMMQYKFPLLNEQEILQFHHDYYQRRTFSNHSDYHFKAARMFLLFSFSALLYRATGRYRGPHPYRFLSSALRHMVFFHNLEPLKKVEILVLLCALVNRTDKDSNCLYLIISDAMKLCNQLNLHKPKSYKNVSSTLRERHLRCFWCAYILERSVSIAVAKPFVLKESKIDNALPLFDNEMTSESVKQNEPHSMQRASPNEISLNVSFINQAIRIRRMESCFVEDLNILSSASIATRAQLPKVLIYFQQLQNWRKECQGFKMGKETEALSVYYYKAVRNLIQPFLELLDPDDKLFKECQAAAGQICQAIKAYHQKTVSGHSILSIHTTFTSGVTLIYCLWLERNRDDMKRKLLGDDKKHTRPLVSAALFSGLDDLRACSISLYVMAERTKFALSFRDSFDELMHATVDNLIIRCGPNSSEILNYTESGMPPAVYRQPMQHYQLDSKFTQKTAVEKREEEERKKATGHLTRLAIPKGLSHLLVHSPVGNSDYKGSFNLGAKSIPTSSSFTVPKKPLMQTSRFAEQSSKFSTQQFYSPPARGMNFGAINPLPSIGGSSPSSAPIQTQIFQQPTVAQAASYISEGGKNHTFKQTTIEVPATSMSAGLNTIHANTPPSPSVHPNNGNSNNTPSSTTTTTTTTTTSSSNNAVTNTPIIPELLPFVGRTTAMINNISVWTGESGQQIPQTGLVMIQQQNNGTSGGNSNFFMNGGAGNINGNGGDNFMGMNFRMPNQTGNMNNGFSSTRQNTTPLFNDMDPTNNSEYDPSADSSNANGIDMLNGWGAYPSDDIWNGRESGFMP